MSLEQIQKTADELGGLFKATQDRVDSLEKNMMVLIIRFLKNFPKKKLYL